MNLLHKNISVFKNIVSKACGIAIFAQLFLVVLYKVPGDCYPWSEYFTVWPAFLWTLIFIPLVPLMFFMQSYRMGLSLILCMTILSIQCDICGRIQFDKSRKDPNAFRLISWNIGGAIPGGFPAALSALAQHKPDIVFFQETPDNDTETSSAVLSIPYFAGFSMHDGGDCAILSRFPLEKVATRSIGPWDKPTLAKAHIGKTSQTLLLCNVRMMIPSSVFYPLAPRLPVDNEQRLKQYDNLSQLLNETCMKENFPLPIVLAGDFNVCGGARSLGILRETLNLRDSWSTSGIGWGGTMPTEIPVARIDQVWLTPNIKPIGSRVLPNMPSDHRPVCVDFTVSTE